MKVFVTGASGWIGSAVVADLLAAGHEVSGLARSDGSAAALSAQGVTVVRGDLDDLDSLRVGAGPAEAVIHLANKHDWGDRAATNVAERAAVQALGETLAGSDRPFLFASGIGGPPLGRPLTEDDASPFHGVGSPRGGSENLGLGFVEQGVRAVSVRFAPTVHGAGDPQFTAMLVATARKRGVSGYPGDGTNRWSAVHRSDAARLVTLGLAGAPAGSRLHAVAEEGVTTRDIAEAIGRACGLPVASIDADDVMAHFGWLGAVFAMDIAATSMLTRTLLDWSPTAPGLIADLDAGAYG